MTKDNQQIFDVFISHASEDKAIFVHPLATAIEDYGYRVWYDSFTLKWGDSLRQSIDRGLERSRYGIVVLSKAFFKKRWPQAELDGLFAREVNGEKIILPIWHGVTEREVQERCPLVAGRLAMSSDDGIENIIIALRDVVGPPIKQPSKKQIKNIDIGESLPDLENLAKNLWWMAHKEPNNAELLTKLEMILEQLRNEISQSQILVPKSVDRTPVTPTPAAFRKRIEKKGISRYDDYVIIGRSGKSQDVDFLMNSLVSESDLASTKLIDFVLGIVNTREGIERIKHYLFHGTQMQRNYAALYFKRKKENAVLEEAQRKGKIDRVQAFSK